MAIAERPRSAAPAELRGRRSPAPAAAAAAAFLVAGCGLAICLEATGGPTQLVPSSWHGMPGWLAGPLPSIGVRLDGSTFAVLLLAMCAAFLLTLLLAGALDPRAAIAAICLAQLSFALAPPLLSSDVFGYVDWARMGALHSLDPYTHGSIALPADPVYPYLRWHDSLPSPYGPLFTLGTYALAPLGLAASLWTLKALAAAASAAIVAFVWRAARLLGRDPVPAAVFCGLNPLLLTFALGGAHNDLLATAVLAGGVYLSLARRERGGAVALVVAGALKASSVIALPYLVLGAVRRRGALVAALVTTAALLALVALGLDGDVLGFFTTLEQQQSRVALDSVPSQAAHLVGLGGVTPGVRVAAAGIMLAVLFLTLRACWRGGSWLTAAGWTTLALLVTTAWLLPWYIVWVLPFAALSDSRRLRLATLALTAFMIAVRLGPWFHMRPPG